MRSPAAARPALYALEPAMPAAASAPNGHALDPATVLALAAALGTPPRHVRIVGCEPARFDDDGELAEGLSDVVAGAVAPAAAMVGALVDELAQELACTS